MTNNLHDEASHLWLELEKTLIAAFGFKEGSKIDATPLINALKKDETSIKDFIKKLKADIEYYKAIKWMRE